MSKVILKTALKTLLIVIFAAAVFLAVMSFGFPQHMATFFENTECYTIATRYASLRYSYTDDVSDLARCAEDSILSGNENDIIEYCAELINHSDYESLCGEKDEYYSTGEYASYTLSYNQYICGKYAVALAGSGEKQQAVEQAFAANGTTSFQRGNAVAVLALWAAENNDSETCSLILSGIGNISVSESETEYYTNILQILISAAG